MIKYKEIYNENKRNSENIFTKSNEDTKIITKSKKKQMITRHNNNNKHTQQQIISFVFSSLLFQIL